MEYFYRTHISCIKMYLFSPFQVNQLFVFSTRIGMTQDQASENGMCNVKDTLQPCEEFKYHRNLNWKKELHVYMPCFHC